MKLVLIGYMGSGKSSVGRLLAAALSYQFIDLDDHIAASEGTSITDLFKKRGEIYFRRKESEVLHTLLANKGNLILATGGGTPCYGTVMEDVLKTEKAVTVYLKNSPGTLTDRLFGEKETRPLIAHLDTKELLNDFIRKHLFERSFFYNKAHMVLDCDALQPREIIEKIILKLF